MKKLLFTLILFTGIHSLLSMEMPNQHNDVAQPEYIASEHIEPVSSEAFSKLPSFVALAQIYHHLADALSKDVAQHILFLQGIKLSPVTLPQIYYHLAETLNKKVAQHIFTLQLGKVQFNNDLIGDLNEKYRLTVIDGNIGGVRLVGGHCLAVEILERALLHRKVSICDIKDNESGMTLLHYTLISSYSNPILFLQVARGKVWTLLTTQKKNTLETSLHYAVRLDKKRDIVIVKLLLDAAGDNVQTFMDIQNDKGKTAFDIAAPEVKELMQQYQNKRSYHKFCVNGILKG